MYPEKYRYPFVYIMEAADDIAYGLSDIADGIEKKIMDLEFLPINLLSYGEKMSVGILKMLYLTMCIN